MCTGSRSVRARCRRSQDLSSGDIFQRINTIDSCLDSKLSETPPPPPRPPPPELLTYILGGLQTSSWVAWLYSATPASCFALRGPLASSKVCGFLASAHGLGHRGQRASPWPPGAPQFPSPAPPLAFPPLGWVRPALLCCLILHTLSQSNYTNVSVSVHCPTRGSV